MTASLTALPNDASMDAVARSIIYNINTAFIERHRKEGSQTSFTSAKARENMDSTIERLHIFLDNTNTMKGQGLTDAKKFFKKIENRVFSTPTNIHLIEVNSRKIVDQELELNEQNIHQYVYNVWNGDGKDRTGYYLWEYVWHAMSGEKNENSDCEIIVITDGYNTYRTGHSTTSYRGINGLTQFMDNLHKYKDQLCRTVVYCVSKECKDEVGRKSFDLAIATGGFSCDDNNVDDCTRILTSSHAERVQFSLDFKKKHFDQVEAGEVEALPFVHYPDSIMKFKREV